MISTININDINRTYIEHMFDDIGYIIGESGDFKLYELTEQLCSTTDYDFFVESFNQLIESVTPLMEITKPVLKNVEDKQLKSEKSKSSTSAYRRTTGQKVKKHIKDFVKTMNKSTLKQYAKGKKATSSVTNDFKTKNGTENSIRNGVNALGGTIRALTMGPKSIAKGLSKGLSRSKTYNKLKRKYHTWRSIVNTKNGDTKKAKSHFNKANDHSKRLKAIKRTIRIKGK